MQEKSEPRRGGSPTGAEDVTRMSESTVTQDGGSVKTDEQLRSCLKQALIAGYCKGMVPFHVVEAHFLRFDLGRC
jgi:hypothetical protein